MADKTYDSSLKPKIDALLRELDIRGEWYVSNNREIVTVCPRCKKPEHFSINILKRAYQCFKCGYKGRIKDESPEAVIDTGSKLKDAISLLMNKFSPSVSDKTWYDLWMTVDARDWPEAKDYLNNRGINDKMIEFYNIRYSFDWKRVVVPNKWSELCRTDMYVARDMTGESKRKYLNPKGVASRNIVFNLHNVIDKYEDVIISEGVFSAISSGFNGVATYGKDVSQFQFDLLCKCNFRRYYISTESDALDYGIKLADKLKAKDKDVYLIELPEGKDANDLGREGFLGLMARTRKYESKFFIESVLDTTKKIEKKNFKIEKNLASDFRKLVLLL